MRILTYRNLHHYSVLKATVDSQPAMAAFWNILATNAVDGGPEFVSLYEGKTLPFYGAQFHAEKNAYVAGLVSVVAPFTPMSRSQQCSVLP